ncbi:MAG TPA: group 1 truncated hemoglobin [Kofleriaceae bacterium]|nr:group 1 truncated hemoglobin [Kofleriaceae bacterium]
MRTIRLMFVAALAASTVVACGGSKKATTAPVAEKSLFDRLGGKDAITTVVDMFVANIAADARINARFTNADIPGLKGKMVDQICAATGGPCKYEGKDMKTAHTGMKLTEEEFSATVEDLTKALNDAKVGDKEKNELLGALGGMKADIVGQ